MLPFNQNLASLSIKVSSRSIIRRKRSDDESNLTGSHEIAIGLFLSFFFNIMNWPVFRIVPSCTNYHMLFKNDREITRTEKKKCKILPYSSEVFAPRYFRFIVWNENFGKICSRQTCIMWTPFGQFFCVWYDICLHKTYNFVLPPDTKFRKRYPRFFLVIWWKRYLFKFTSFRTPTLEIIIWINIYVVLFDR